MNIQTMIGKPWLTFAVVIVELMLAYIFASLAINSGSLWQWGLGIVLVIGALRNLVNLISKPLSRKI